MFLLHALLLRLQSGSDSRHCALREISWADVAKHEYVVGLDECTFSVKIAPSKVLTKDATPLEYYANDPITAALFGYWHSLHSAAGKWLFPKVSKWGQFDFNAQVEYKTHKEACQLCVEVLGLQVSQQFISALGANAVRRGNAAKVGVAVKGANFKSSYFTCTLSLLWGHLGVVMDSPASSSSSSSSSSSAFRFSVAQAQYSAALALYSVAQASHSAAQALYSAAQELHSVVQAL